VRGSTAVPGLVPGTMRSHRSWELRGAVRCLSYHRGLFAVAVAVVVLFAVAVTVPVLFTAAVPHKAP
jgi:hypothetical protein